jgi:hypothetical protein
MIAAWFSERDLFLKKPLLFAWIAAAIAATSMTTTLIASVRAQARPPEIYPLDVLMPATIQWLNIHAAPGSILFCTRLGSAQVPLFTKSKIYWTDQAEDYVMSDSEVALRRWDNTHWTPQARWKLHYPADYYLGTAKECREDADYLYVNQKEDTCIIPIGRSGRRPTAFGPPSPAFTLTGMKLFAPAAIRGLGGLGFDKLGAKGFNGSVFPNFQHDLLVAFCDIRDDHAGVDAGGSDPVSPPGLGGPSRQQAQAAPRSGPAAGRNPHLYRVFFQYRHAQVVAWIVGHRLSQGIGGTVPRHAAQLADSRRGHLGRCSGGLALLEDRGAGCGWLLAVDARV